MTSQDLANDIQLGETGVATLIPFFEQLFALFQHPTVAALPQTAQLAQTAAVIQAAVASPAATQPIAPQSAVDSAPVVEP